MKGNSHKKVLRISISFLLFITIIFIAVGPSFASDNNSSNTTEHNSTNKTITELKKNSTLPDPTNTRTGVHYTSLQAAINDAESWDTITAEAGTYYENLVITKNIYLIGAGKDTTIINGQQLSSVITLTPGVVVTITGFTITNGKAQAGGGIFNNGGTLTLQNSTVAGNKVFSDTTTIFGAGIYNRGSLTLQNSQVSGNTMLSLDSRGGGIYNDGGSVMLQNSQITGNTGNGGSSVGGGIYNFRGNVILQNSQITGNTLHAAYSFFCAGAGIYNEGNVTSLNSQITGNSLSAFEGFFQSGGGIYNLGSVYSDYISSINGNTPDQVNGNSIIIVPCVNLRTWTLYFTIQDAINNALDGDTISIAPGTYYKNLVVNRNINIIGAGKDITIIDGQQKDSVIIINPDIIATISGFTIRNGNAERGGGVFINGATLTLQNSTVTGNTATYGGGIWNGYTLTLINSQVTGNTYGWLGGGICNCGSGLVIINSQISGNRKSGNDCRGGGIYNYYGAIGKLQNSTITGNTAVYGGGVYNDSWFYADSLSRISGNSPNDVAGNPITTSLSTAEGIPTNNVSAASTTSSTTKTLRMHETGIPITGLLFAVLMVLGGLSSRRR